MKIEWCQGTKDVIKILKVQGRWKSDRWLSDPISCHLSKYIVDGLNVYILKHAICFFFTSVLYYFIFRSLREFPIIQNSQSKFWYVNIIKYGVPWKEWVMYCFTWVDSMILLSDKARFREVYLKWSSICKKQWPNPNIYACEFVYCYTNMEKAMLLRSSAIKTRPAVARLGLTLVHAEATLSAGCCQLMTGHNTGNKVDPFLQVVS